MEKLAIRYLNWVYRISNPINLMQFLNGNHKDNVLRAQAMHKRTENKQRIESALQIEDQQVKDTVLMDLVDFDFKYGRCWSTFFELDNILKNIKNKEPYSARLLDFIKKLVAGKTVDDLLFSRVILDHITDQTHKKVGDDILRLATTK